MDLTASEMDVCNNTRKLIMKTFTKEKLENIICLSCNGTGLSNVFQHSTGTGWNLGSFCDKCRGLGYILVGETSTHSYYCDKCNGTGDYGHCKNCNGSGRLNWLQHIFGGVGK